MLRIVPQQLPKQPHLCIYLEGMGSNLLSAGLSSAQELCTMSLELVICTTVSLGLIVLLMV